MPSLVHIDIGSDCFCGKSTLSIKRAARWEVSLAEAPKLIFLTIGHDSFDACLQLTLESFHHFHTSALDLSSFRVIHSTQPLFAQLSRCRIVGWAAEPQ